MMTTQRVQLTGHFDEPEYRDDGLQDGDGEVVDGFELRVQTVDGDKILHEEHFGKFAPADPTEPFPEMVNLLHARGYELGAWIGAVTWAMNLDEGTTRVDLHWEAAVTGR